MQNSRNTIEVRQQRLFLEGYDSTIQYAVVGAAFGLIFPIAATILVFMNRDLPLTFSSFMTAHSGDPLLWIIDTAPLFLGFVAALAGRREDRLRETTDELARMVGTLEFRVGERTRDLDRAVAVGHMIGQVVEIESMLERAASLIRSSFDLSEVHLYLMDAAGQMLEYRANSGGESPSGTRTRLPLNNSSTVGAAATRKQSMVVSGLESMPAQSSRPAIESWSQAAVPLFIGDRIIGVLDTYSDEPERLKPDRLPALETVAGQLAISIENARLVAEANRAREEIEEHARELARIGWQEFLNAIERSQRPTYVYEREGTLVQDGQYEYENRLNIPITVTGEKIGSIQVEGEVGQEWSFEDLEFAVAISEHVSRQLENLRLLSEADRYRAESEEATRRITREAWETYLASREADVSGYAFEHNRVEPLDLTGPERSPDPVVSWELSVRGIKFGQLEVAELEEPDEETLELIAAVSDQLSAHLENLRLSEKTETALSEAAYQVQRLGQLNEFGQQLAGAANLDDVYRIVGRETPGILPADKVSIALLQDGAQVEILTLDNDKGTIEVSELAPTAGTEIGKALQENRVILATGEASGMPELVAMMVAPMRASGRPIGALSVGTKSSEGFSESDNRLLLQIASLLASSIESRKLLAETEKRAQELSLINRMAQAVSKQLSVSQLVETVFSQLRTSLDPDVIQLGFYNPDSGMADFPIYYDRGSRKSLFDLSVDPESPVVKALVSGQPYLFNASDAESETLSANREMEFEGEIELPATSSRIYLPLQTAKKSIGILSLQSYRADRYGESDLSMLSGIASYVSVALDNAHLFEEIQDRMRRERILREVTERVRGTVDVDTVMRTAAMEVGRALGRRTYVYLGKETDQQTASETVEESTHEG